MRGAWRSASNYVNHTELIPDSLSHTYKEEANHNVNKVLKP